MMNLRINMVDDVFPIHTSPLEIRWQRVISDAEHACEFRIDKEDINFTLNSFRVEQDITFKTITLTGAGFNIHWLNRMFLKVFKTCFYREFSGYKFKFIEEKK